MTGRPPPPPGRFGATAVLVALVAAGTTYVYAQACCFPLLPYLRDELNTTTAWASWLVSVFFLASTIAPPVLGRLGDQFGKRRLLLVSLGVFVVGSVGAVAAPDIRTLIAFRAVQGLGGAIFPLSVAILKDELPPLRLPVAVGIISTVFAAGGALGVGLSGLIADVSSWRVAFAVIAVLSVASLVLCWVVVPESPNRVQARVDVIGAVLLAVALLAFMLAITEGEEWGWASPQILGLVTVACASAAAWVVAELRVDAPMVDMRMLMHRPVLLANGAAFALGVPLVAIGVLVPLFAGAPSRGVVDYGFDAAPTSVGWILFPSGFAGILSGALGGILIRRSGPRPSMIVGTGLVIAAYAYLLFRREGPWDLFVASALLGVGSPFNHAAINTMLVTGVAPSQSGVAMGMNTVMRSLGMVIGSQVSAAILAADTVAGTDTSTEHAFVLAFLMCIALGGVGACLSLLTPGGRRRPVAASP